MSNRKHRIDDKSAKEWQAIHDDLKLLVSIILESCDREGTLLLANDEVAEGLYDQLMDVFCDLENMQERDANNPDEFPAPVSKCLELMIPILDQLRRALGTAASRAFQLKSPQRVSAKFVSDLLHAAHKLSNALHGHMPEGMPGGTIGPTRLLHWDDDAEGFITSSEAVVLFEYRFSLSTLSKMCTPQGNIDYMRKNQRLKVRLNDLKRVMGREPSDRDVKRYEERIEANKKQVRNNNSSRKKKN